MHRVEFAGPSHSSEPRYTKQPSRVYTQRYVSSYGFPEWGLLDTIEASRNGEETVPDGEDYDQSISKYIWVDFDPDMLQYILSVYQNINPENVVDNNNNNGNDNSHNGSNSGNGRDNDSYGNRTSHHGADASEASATTTTNASTIPSWLRDPTGTYDIDEEDCQAARSEVNGSQDSESSSEHSAFASATSTSTSTFSSNNRATSEVSSGANGSNITSSTSSSAAVNYALFAANAGQQAQHQGQQSVIVLREELDYFVIPLNGKCNGDISLEHPGFALDNAKTRCGRLLMFQRNVFEPLDRSMRKNMAKAERAAAEAERSGNSFSSISASNVQWLQQNAGVVEQQLIEMLCVSGFNRNATWGCRRVEPNRNSLSSLSLVRLREAEDHEQMLAVQKLSLFYKKPARKCWWDGDEVNLGTDSKPIKAKLWCRRIWTLELVMV